MKDTFQTTPYKGGFIHSCYNRETGREEFTVQLSGITREVPSIRAAKHLLTRAETASKGKVANRHSVKRRYYSR